MLRTAGWRRGSAGLFSGENVLADAAEVRGRDLQVRGQFTERDLLQDFGITGDQLQIAFLGRFAVEVEVPFMRHAEHVLGKGLLDVGARVQTLPYPLGVNHPHGGVCRGLQVVQGGRLANGAVEVAGQVVAGSETRDALFARGVCDRILETPRFYEAEMPGNLARPQEEIALGVVVEAGHTFLFCIRNYDISLEVRVIGVSFFLNVIL